MHYYFIIPIHVESDSEQNAIAAFMNWIKYMYENGVYPDTHKRVKPSLKGGYAEPLKSQGVFIGPWSISWFEVK